MKTNRLIQIIAGIVLIVGGIICFCNPIESEMILVWMIIIGMLVNAISSIATWNQKRKVGLANGWNLFGSIISLLFALVLLVNIFARFFMITAMIYLVMAWMIIIGIMQIMAAMQLKKLRASDSMLGQNWVLVLIFGIIMILAGLVGLSRPLGMAIAIGWIFGINLVVNGINLLIFSGDEK